MIHTASPSIPVASTRPAAPVFADPQIAAAMDQLRQAGLDVRLHVHLRRDGYTPVEHPYNAARERMRRIAEEVLAGAPARDVAAKYGVSRQAVYNCCDRHGVGRIHECSKAMNERLRLANTLAREGNSTASIAERIGVTQKTVAIYLGLTTKKGPPRIPDKRYRAIVLLMTTELSLAEIGRRAGFASCNPSAVVMDIRNKLERAGATLGRHNSRTPAANAT